MLFVAVNSFARSLSRGIFGGISPFFHPESEQTCYNQRHRSGPFISEPAAPFPDDPTGGLRSAKKMNQETLARAAGALLSLAFSYLPGLGARYAARTDSFLRFYIRLWFPSRMRFRIRFIHEKHLRIEQPIWVRPYPWPMRSMPAFIRYECTF